MKTNLKPANSKALALLKKLQALAEQGIDGENVAAQSKMAQLFDRNSPVALYVAVVLTIGN